MYAQSNTNSWNNLIICYSSAFMWKIHDEYLSPGPLPKQLVFSSSFEASHKEMFSFLEIIFFSQRFVLVVDAN